MFESDMLRAIQLLKIKYDIKTWRIPQFPNLEKKNILVMGNAPSFKNIDYNLFKKNDYYIAVVNSTILNQELMNTIKPNFGIVIDRMIFDGTIEERYQQMCDVLNSISWNFTMILPMGYRDYTKEITNSYVTISYVNMKRTMPKDCINNDYLYRRYRANLNTPATWNVLSSAIYFFASSGAKTIALGGAEMNMFLSLRVDANNRVYYMNNHYYEIKDTVAEYGDVKFGPVAEGLRYYSYMFEEFNKLDEYIKWIGNIEVVNLSENSYIDAFKKIDYFEYIKKLQVE